ncbi:Radical SAM superfamily enzyme with C-terminal helix-hairpin-helix motif [Marinitoga hydrogenitolerans DSM 16785]|uniref:Radical SAM superfamily enzyme with C-terminal helix-hairpin-helix motif n=1 Tax=Marinitoga hydrogenitolerans (strain DSM 16785 / JCM 12826 / AT1271) TaxID=1122195 RepID=A0A1M4UT13_MARH1|nr:radical SAM protein [Marinitoga hydrogenitolerans]SHE59818.1 Radical SAM superfamily enzyme with C-terminal helix-hairpin-helix motif [Marinitoga hydrogenitolerans DSM 16785]
MKAVIIDGYVDEPAILGVPPYVSPYIRYAAGALYYHGIDVDYFTIDQIRENQMWQSFNHYEYLIIIAGVTVPGHYLGGTPISLTEINKLFSLNKEPLRVLGGPIVKGYTLTGGRSAIKIESEYIDYMVEGDVERFLFTYPISDNFNLKDRSNYELISKITPLGAEILKKHPRFPDIIVEMDVSRGCERTNGFCSFCTEPLINGKYRERPIKDLLEEAKAISDIGVKNFRFGRAADFLAYGSLLNNGEPNIPLFNELYQEMSKIANIIHTDNANPAYIIKHQDKIKKILEIIVKYNTAGDILSFGIESFDKNVIEKNRIDIMPDEAIEAIRIVNEIGNKRDKNGIPKLLPGINLLFGLIDETKETFEINKKYLEKIMDENLLVRRINVRQVMAFPGTLLYNTKPKQHKKDFIKFKEYMEKYNHEMLKKVFPIGSILENLIIEKNQGKISFGRQLGTYPIKVGVIGEFNILDKINGVVIDHGSRSITALKLPFDINKATLEELTSINGIGKKTAENIILKRPIDDLNKLNLNGKTLDLLSTISRGCFYG